MAYGEPITIDELEGRTAVDLIARTIYGEAEGESLTGKKGVAWVIRKRVEFDGEWGNTYKNVVLNGGFYGLTSSRGLAPNTNSTAWTDSLAIANNIKNASASENPIGTCLWFNTTALYDSVLAANNGKYKFGTRTYEVVENVELGNHTFFRIEGYEF